MFWLSVMVTSLVSGSPPSSSEGSNRRLLVYQHCIPLCESGDLQAEVAADIIGLLMLEVTQKPDHDVVVSVSI